MDDCEFGWYACDLASACYFITSTVDYSHAAEMKTALEKFIVPFLSGYLQQENPHLEYCQWLKKQIMSGGNFLELDYRQIWESIL